MRRRHLQSVALLALVCGQLRAQAEVQPTGTRLALLIGVSRYPSSASDIPTLAGPRHDVIAMQGALEGLGFKSADIRVLLDDEATMEGCIRAFDSHLIARAGPGAEIVVYFAGHGSTVPDRSGREAMTNGVPSDTSLLLYDSRGEGRRGGYDLSDDVLRSLLSAVAKRGARVTLITDACHSGGALRGGRVGVARFAGAGAEPITDPTIWPGWPKDVAYTDDDAAEPMPRVVHVGACTKEQLAYEYAFETPDGVEVGGAFTHCLVASLYRVAPGATWRDVAAYAAHALRELPEALPQTLWLDGDCDATVLGGDRRSPHAGYEVTLLPAGALLRGGHLHGLDVGAELDVVTYGGDAPVGRLRIDRLGFASSRAEWVGDAPPVARVPMIARLARAPESLPPIAVEATAELAARWLVESPWVTVADARSAYVLTGRDDAVTLATREGRPVWASTAVAAADQLESLAVALRREVQFRALARLPDQAELGALRGLSLIVRPATPAELEANGRELCDRWVAADIHQEPLGAGFTATVPAFGSQEESRTGSLAVFEVANRTGVSVHLALISLEEAGGVASVVWTSPPDQPLAHGARDKAPVWVGAAGDEAWPLARPMRDRYLLLATETLVDWRASLRGAHRGDAFVPAVLARAVTPVTTRGQTAPVSPAGWGLTWLDLWITRPDPFPTPASITAVAVASDLDSARAQLRRALATATLPTATLTGFATLAQGLLEFDLAVATWRRATVAAAERGRTREACEAARQCADLLLALGQSESAVNVLRASLDRATVARDSLLERATRVNLARACLQLGDLDAARPLAEAAWTEASGGDARVEAVRTEAAPVLAAILAELGQHDAAHAVESELLAKLEPAGGREELCWPRLSLAASKAALVGQAASEPLRAATLRSELLALLAAALEADAGDARELGERRLSGGLSLVRAGLAQRALPLLGQAVSDLTESDAPDAPTLLRKARSGLAAARFQTGDIDGAYELAAVLVAADREGGPDPRTLQGMASILFAKGQYARARASMRSAFEGAARRLDVLGRGLSLAEQRLVRRELRDALDSLLSCRDEAGDTAAQDADDLAAVLQFRSALDRQARALARVQAGAREAGPLRVLLAAYREACAREGALARIAGISPEQLSAARAARDRAERDLLAQFEPESAAPGILGPINVPSGGAALVTVRYTRYVATQPGSATPPGEPRVAAFLALPGQRVTRFELGSAAGVAAAVQRLRQALRSAAGIDVRGRSVTSGKVAAGLSLSALMRPVVEAIPSETVRLLVCPDADLAAVPFEVLSRGGGLLMDNVEVTYAEHPAWGRAPRDAAGTGGMLVVGDVDYGTGGQGAWAPLAGSRREREQVASLFRAASSGADIHSLGALEATRDAILTIAPTCAFVHLATHGFAREVRGETLAGLALSGANRDADGGSLWVGDLLALDLSSCRLAVLSACDSGQGDRDAGEAVAGLNRALVLAGARATITSLWPIADQEAPRFFAAFYGHLLSGGLTPAAALAVTRRELRVAGASPATWAGFVLYRGAPRGD